MLPSKAFLFYFTLFSYSLVSVALEKKNSQHLCYTYACTQMIYAHGYLHRYAMIFYRQTAESRDRLHCDRRKFNLYSYLRQLKIHFVRAADCNPSASPVPPLTYRLKLRHRMINFRIPVRICMHIGETEYTYIGMGI